MANHRHSDKDPDNDAATLVMWLGTIFFASSLASSTDDDHHCPASNTLGP